MKRQFLWVKSPNFAVGCLGYGPRPPFVVVAFQKREPGAVRLVTSMSDPETPEVELEMDLFVRSGALSPELRKTVFEYLAVHQGVRPEPMILEIAADLEVAGTPGGDA